MNTLLSIFLLVFGIYLLYSTYKKTAPRFSSDLKGYLGGIGLICLCILSLIGKFNLFETVKDILNIK
jgi:hypothetical protein